MYITINKIRLNYEVEGSGDPLILLHGNGEDLHIFDKLRNRLKNDFQIYAIDSRNHGLSSSSAILSYNTLAEDIHLFIKNLGLERPSVIGFSDGAIITTILAIKYPDLLNKIALVGVNLKPTDFKPEVLKELVLEYNNTKDPLLSLMLHEPTIELDELKSIKAKTLIIAAENDLFCEDSFKKMKESIRDSVLKIIAGHDHGSYIINEDLLYPDLKTFFCK